MRLFHISIFLAFLSSFFHSLHCLPLKSTASFILLDSYTLQLADIASQYGEDMLIVAGVGTMNATLDENNNCVDAKWTVTINNLLLLQKLAQHCVQHGMGLYVGLLDISNDGPFEWSACMVQYATMSAQAAVQVEETLALYAGLNWNWYIAQEMDITGLSDNPPLDGETQYYNLLIEAVNSNVSNPYRSWMASPYYTDSSNLSAQALKLAQFTAAVPKLTYMAPQDGVGSFGYGVNVTNALWKNAYQMFQMFNLEGKLWANCESFLYPAEICKACTKERYHEQIKAVENYAGKIINWVKKRRKQ